MPLYPGAEQLIKQNLEEVKAGKKPPLKAIGRLTDQQHQDVNALRQSLNLPGLVNPEVIYMGRHHYESRSTDGYCIDDMYLQIDSAMSADSVVLGHTKMTALQNPNARGDGYGNQVQDLAVLELTNRKPRAELYSAIPKGDKIKPADINAKRLAETDEPF